MDAKVSNCRAIERNKILSIIFTCVFIFIAFSLQISKQAIQEEIDKQVESIKKYKPSGIGFGSAHFRDGSSKGFMLGSRRHKEMMFEQNVMPLETFLKALPTVQVVFVIIGLCTGFGFVFYFKQENNLRFSGNWNTKVLTGATSDSIEYDHNKESINNDNKDRETNMNDIQQIKTGSIGKGIIWMIFISIILFWLPVVGPFIAGLVGGKKSGGVMAGISAAVLPGLIFGALLFAMASTISGFPLIGAIAGAGGIALALAHVGPLLIGAIIGGLFAK